MKQLSPGRSIDRHLHEHVNCLLLKQALLVHLQEDITTQSQSILGASGGASGELEGSMGMESMGDGGRSDSRSMGQRRQQSASQAMSIEELATTLSGGRPTASSIPEVINEQSLRHSTSSIRSSVAFPTATGSIGAEEPSTPHADRGAEYPGSGPRASAGAGQPPRSPLLDVRASASGKEWLALDPVDWA